MVLAGPSSGQNADVLGSLWRRVGVVAAAVVLVSAAPAAPVGADGAIEDSLIDRVDGFELVPEVFGGSGPMTAEDMTSLLGVDRDHLPEELFAYLRMFDSASGDVALVLGVSFPDADDGLFLAGFTEAGQAQGEGTRLFTDEIGPLRHMLAYEVTQAGTTITMTAFEAEKLGVVLGVGGSQAEALPTLRDMVQRQAALTHPRATKPRLPEGESASYQAGEWFGRLLFVGFLAFAPVVTIVLVVQNQRRQRERRRSAAAAGWPGPGPGYPPPWAPPGLPPPPLPPAPLRPPGPPPSAVPVEPVPPSAWGPLDTS